MWLNKANSFLNIITGPTAKGVNFIAAGVLVAMMILTGADVTLRYVLNKPVPGSWEITEYMMPIVVALGLAYCALERGHVRVDLVVSRLSEHAQAVMNSLASLIFLGIFILITWQSVLRAREMIEIGITSHTLYIPVAPFVLVVTVGSAVLCLVLLREFIGYLCQAVKK